MRSPDRATTVVGLLVAIGGLGLADTASAQTGTVHYNAATFTTPGPHTLSFNLTGVQPAGASTTILLHIAQDGNAAAPLAADPLSDPTSVVFTLTRTGDATPVTFTAQQAQQPSGFAAPTGTIPNREVAASRAGVDPGLYVITITPTTTISSGTSEPWTLEIAGLPATTRGTASLDDAEFAGLSPAGACSTGCADGEVCMLPPGPCPSVCPVGQTCRGPCPFRPCVGPIIIGDWPVVRIPGFPPPSPCLSCPPHWIQPFDDRAFDRVIIMFSPTNEQRQVLEARQGEQVQFHVAGGELVGAPFEAAGGELMQMVQYPRGDPPRVSVTAAGVTTEEFSAAPPADGVSPVYRLLTWLFGVLLGIAAAVGGVLKRRPDHTRGTAA